MIICPKCASETLSENGESCDACGWHRFDEEGIQNFLTEEERVS
jgi:ribosomal protein L37E